MVGLVLVSHSPALAKGLRDMADQVAQGKVSIATAAGIAGGRLGTNALRVADAIREVMNDSGVLVLVDIGSAVMAVGMALELLRADERAVVQVSGGPFVEGTVMAAVQASVGSSLPEVAAAAATARELPKGSVLTPGDERRHTPGATGTTNRRRREPRAEVPERS